MKILYMEVEWFLLIRYINQDYRIKAEKEIIGSGLQYYFNVNQINSNTYEEQYIYDQNNMKIAAVIGLNSDKKKEIKESINKTIIKCHYDAFSNSLVNKRREDENVLDAVTQLTNKITNNIINGKIQVNIDNKNIKKENLLKQFDYYNKVN